MAGDVKFIRVNGRVVPIRSNRLKKQAATGAAVGVVQGAGLRFLAAGKKRTGAALVGASVAANLVGDLFAINDAVKVGKKAGFGAGLKEYGKQWLARTGGQVVGGLAAPAAMSGAAKALKATANAKKSWGLRKSTGIKDVYPSHRSPANLLTHGKK